MIIKSKTLLILLFIGIGHLSIAQDAKKLSTIKAALPVIDKLYKDYMNKEHIPALSYGLILDGKLIHTFHQGQIDITKKSAPTSQSDFHIASMTKSFTAMAIMKLRDEGKIKLDDPVYLYIPGMKDQNYLTSDTAPITIRQLLTHTAGFPEDNPWGDRQLAISDEQLINMIKKGISFSNAPGYTFEYSNMGFAMLGYIIKTISGQPYGKYITQNILLPLGMRNTYWEYTEVPSNQLVHGYRWINQKWIEQPMLKHGAYGAMGGLITTMDDLSKYVAFYLSSWPPSNNEETGPIKRSSLREMQYTWSVNNFFPNYKYATGRECPMIYGYGYGLRTSRDCEDRISVGHSGGLPGFGSDWKILPDYGLGIITFANHTYAPTAVMNFQALDTLIALAQLQPKKIPVSAILNQRKNELIRLLPKWENAQASGIFAENFFMDYFPETLKKETTRIFNRAGKIIRVQEFVPTNNLRGSFIMEGQKANIQISFTLTPENPALIQSYKIRELPKNQN